RTPENILLDEEVLVRPGVDVSPRESEVRQEAAPCGLYGGAEGLDLCVEGTEAGPGLEGGARERFGFARQGIDLNRIGGQQRRVEWKAGETVQLEPGKLHRIRRVDPLEQDLRPARLRGEQVAPQGGAGVHARLHVAQMRL